MHGECLGCWKSGERSGPSWMLRSNPAPVFLPAALATDGARFREIRRNDLSDNELETIIQGPKAQMLESLKAEP
jgi:hypothetical protein